MRRFCSVVLVAALVAGCYPTIHKVKLSSGNERELHPLLLVRGSKSGTVFTVWTREGNEQFGVSPHLFFRKGGLKGGSFSQAVSLGSIVGGTEADLAVAGSHVYVAFADGPVLSATDAVLQVSHDTGDTFERVVVSEEQPCRAPLVAAQGQTVHVAWGHVLGPVRYRRSLDAAASFEDVVTLAESAVLARPGLVAEGQTVAVAWTEDGSARLARIDDEGATFAEPVAISGSGAIVQAASVRLLLDGAALHLLWIEDVGGERRLMHAHMGVGLAELPSVRRVDDGAGVPSEAWMAAEGDAGHVVWQADVTNQSEVLYAFASGSGAFSTPVDLSASSGTTSLSPRVSANNGKAHVVWTEGGDVVYRRGSAQGAFSGALVIEPEEPELSGHSARVHGRLDEDRSVLWISQRLSGTDVWYYSFRPYRID